MKIVLSGVQTSNKGAELMLYAILQEIERKYPDATVYLPSSRIRQGKEYIKSNLDFRIIPFGGFMAMFHISGILHRLHLPQRIITKTNIVKKADWFIDGSGFAFGDQFRLTDTYVEMWEDVLKYAHSDGCKIVFLPQAFGPFERNSSKKILSVLNRYANILIPREQVSYDYLEKSGIVDMRKVRKYTDFTSLVEGEFPKGYEHLQSGICIIPNIQMINKGVISYPEYLNLLTSIIEETRKSGRPVYLLNHAGSKDAELCRKCKQDICGDIEAVTNLNALQVKGLIASAYMVVTSRFHGLASALNSCVPALATSWSHKYEELYKDYALDGFVLPIESLDLAIARIQELLPEKANLRIRQHLSLQVCKVREETNRMWEEIWRL